MKKFALTVTLLTVFQANACKVTEHGEGRVTMKGCNAEQRAEYIRSMPVVVVAQKPAASSPKAAAPKAAPKAAVIAASERAEFDAYKRQALDEFNQRLSAVEKELASAGSRGRDSAFAELDSF